MYIVIRTDASHLIGHGHVQRGLALAEALRGAGHAVVFICQELSGDLREAIKKQKFTVLTLAAKSDVNLSENEDADLTLAALNKIQKIDIMVVDHYGLGISWETICGAKVKRLMVIDDFFDRTHKCDIYFNQTLLDKSKLTWVVPEQTLLGPEFALLRPEFVRLKKERTLKSEFKQLLLFFGGGDQARFNLEALKAVRLLKNRDLQVHVVLSTKNSHFKAVQQQILLWPQCHLHSDVKNMAVLMNQMDFYVGSGGTITWERCCLGLSGLVIAMADNQAHFSEALDKQGCHQFLGTYQNISAQDLALSLTKLLEQPQSLQKMSQKSFDLVDGLGVERVVKAMSIL